MNIKQYDLYINIYSSFIGKEFQVNKYKVQIEDVIAEGELIKLNNY